MSLSKRVNLLSILILAAYLCGCGPSTPPAPPVPPTKPLTEAQEKLLKEIEALPKAQRREYVMQHMTEIAQYSSDNKAFGDRMTAAAK